MLNLVLKERQVVMYWVMPASSGSAIFLLEPRGVWRACGLGFGISLWRGHINSFQQVAVNVHC